MKQLSFWFLVEVCLLAAADVFAAVRYVDVNSAGPTPPYLSWSTAATNIQDAVDAAVAGDQIMVTNGVYETGHRVVVGDETNRVVVDKALDVVSVNGPQFTIISGSGLVRCVYLTNGASLSGFSLTNGATTGSGGGVLGASKSASVSNCVLSGNSASTGGGAYGVTLSRCTVAGNSATRGGGVGGAALTACSVVSNSAVLHGGGVYGTQLRPTALTNCTLIGNSALYGGGAYGENTTTTCTLANCTVVGNSAPGDLDFVTGDHGGGGAHSSRLINSIIHYNQGRGERTDNVNRCTVITCCITPLSLSGNSGSSGNNITNAPLFVDTNGWANLRLQSSSPCINAGNNDYVTRPVDVEGQERIVGGTVDMGAYEWVAMPTHYVSLSSPNPTAPYLSWSTAATTIQDAVDAAVAGEEIVVTNGLYATGGRAVHGTMTNRVVIDKAVTVRSVNGPETTVIEGRAVAGTTNGDGAVRCVYLGTNAVLSGFTLTNGHTRMGGDYQERCGGGAWCEVSGVLTNCILADSSADVEGGGAYSGTLNNCTLTGNSAIGQSPSPTGGGATRSTLNACILRGNWAGVGGGAAFSTLYECILTGNSAQIGGGTLYGTINNSTFTSNSTTGDFGRGGGASHGTLNNCTLTGNSAYDGGGADQCTLNYCTLTRNSAFHGGGASLSTLNNCNLGTNSAEYSGGGGGHVRAQELYTDRQFDHLLRRRDVSGHAGQLHAHP